MRKIKEVLRLKFELGLGQQEIARACSISQGAVHNYLKKAAGAGMQWPLPEGWDAKRIEEAVFGKQLPIEESSQRALNQRVEREDRYSSMIARARESWLPTDDDILKQFHSAEGEEANQQLFRMEHIFNDLGELGEPSSRFFTLLEIWVNLALSPRGRSVALAALQLRGTRVALKRLRSCFTVAGLDISDKLFENVPYVVHRRTLEQCMREPRNQGGLAVSHGQIVGRRGTK
jgi:predicted transcriptional regulator